jgi:hypothetical protein
MDKFFASMSKIPLGKIMSPLRFDEKKTGLDGFVKVFRWG